MLVQSGIQLYAHIFSFSLQYFLENTYIKRNVITTIRFRQFEDGRSEGQKA